MDLGMIVAGGLQGLGKGIADKGAADMAAATKREESEAEHRRNLALEGLRQEYDIERLGVTADLNDRNDARSTARGLSADLTRDTRQAETQAERDERLRRFDVDDREDSQAHNIESLRIASELRQREDSASKEQAARIERELASGVLDRVEIADDGSFIKFYRDGRTTRVGGARATPKAATAGSGSIVDTYRGGGAPPQRPPAVQYKFDPKTGELVPVGG